jgi:hypothetical protein
MSGMVVHRPEIRVTPFLLQMALPLGWVRHLIRRGLELLESCLHLAVIS